MEINELNKNSFGGTEMIARALESKLPPRILDKVQLIHSRVREFTPDKKHVLVLHDLPNDPEVEHLKDPELRKRFDGIVCVSDWSMNMYNLISGLPYEKTHVIYNAIEPFSLREDNRPDKIKLIYHTTPHRGLALLYPIFEKLCETHNDIELDVFSSFKIYGWDERDKEFEELFDKCKAHPSINYYGFKPNEMVREHLQKAHIFSYPCIWAETSCIAAIEALSAGCLVVAPNLAALPETMSRFGIQYQWAETAQEHAERAYSAINGTINYLKNNFDEYKTNRHFQQLFFNRNYSWKNRMWQWERYLEHIIEAP